MIPYAGIGSRETPDHILDLMYRIGATLGSQGFILRSGGADGADTAFERGCDSVSGSKEIFIPWSGYNGRKFRDGAIVPFHEPETKDRAWHIASQVHPVWHRLKDSVRELHTRNVAQVLGRNLTSHSKFVVCYTRNASGQGGTGQALRIAVLNRIPIFDLGDKDLPFVVENLRTYCELLIHPEIAEAQ